MGGRHVGSVAGRWDLMAGRDGFRVCAGEMYGN